MGYYRGLAPGLSTFGPRPLELYSSFSGIMILELDLNGERKFQGWEPEEGTSQDHRPWPHNHRAAAEVDMSKEEKEEENENTAGAHQQ